MSGPDIGIAIASILIQATEILSKILATANEIKHFRSDCQDLSGDCALILDLVSRNKEKMVKHSTLERVRKVFDDCLIFTKECCEDWGVLQVSFEITFKKKRRKLKEDAKWVLSFLTVDILTELLEGQQQFRDGVTGLFGDAQKKIETERDNFQAEIRAMTREVVESQTMTINVPKLWKSIRIFSLADVKVDEGALESSAAVIQGEIAGYGDVECHRMVDESSSASVELKRLINIYSKISQRTAAQELHGILETPCRNYAVMEGLSGAHLLEESLCSNQFLTFPLIVRLRFIYEICNAICYFHSIGILLKSLSTEFIFFKESKTENGHIRPILTGLENARLITEPSIEKEYDLRFEAPDFANQGQGLHTVYTDIWSLAVVMRYCLSGGLPLDCSSLDAKANKSLIRKKLGDPTFLWDHPDIKSLPKIKSLLRDCFSMAANLRPSISAISAVVLDSFTELAYIEYHGSPITSTDEVEQLEQQLARRKGIELVDAARLKQSPSSKLSGNEWGVLVQCSKVSENPIYSFLVGAIAYWELVADDDIKEYDPTDTVARVQFALKHLTAAAEAGYVDADVELCKVHQYLLARYEKSRKVRKSMILGQA